MLNHFTIRDLREKTGELVRTAEGGDLSVVTKRGEPVFLAVPFDQAILDKGLQPYLALQLFKEKTLSLNKAARLSGMDLEAFMEFLGAHKVPVLDLSAEDLDAEFADLVVPMQ